VIRHSLSGFCGWNCGDWTAFTSVARLQWAATSSILSVHRSRLIIEVDGGVHELEVVAQRDAARDVWLSARGYRALRLTNREVIGDIEAMVRRIIAAAGACTPTPDPSPQGTYIRA